MMGTAERKSLEYQTVTLSTGDVIQMFKDGRKVQRSTSGVVLEIFPDGTKIQTSASNVKIILRPDGSRLQINQDTGIEIETFADGTTEQRQKDGTTVRAFSDGTREQITADGIRILIAKDGSREQRFPDGTVIFVSRDGQTTTQRNSDGTTIKRHSSGMIEKNAPGIIERSGPAPAAVPPPLPVRTAPKPLNQRRSVTASYLAGESQPGRSSLNLDGGLMGILQRQTSVLQEENERLKATLKNIQEKATEDLRSQAAQSQADYASLLKEYQESKEKAEKATSLQQTVNLKTRELERLKLKQESDLETMESRFKADLALKEKSNVQLLQQVDELLSAKEKSAQALLKQGNSQGAQVAQLESQIAQLSKDLGDTKEQAAKLKQERDNAKSWESKAKQAAESLDEANKKIDALEGQVEELIFKGGSCAEMLGDLRLERDQVVRDRDAAYDKAAGLTDKLAQMVEELTLRESELTEAFHEISRLSEDATIARNESLTTGMLDEARERIKELEKRLVFNQNVATGTGQQFYEQGVTPVVAIARG